jgi:hypothetical protein
MSGEMGLNVSLGGYSNISIVRIGDSASTRGSLLFKLRNSCRGEWECLLVPSRGRLPK